MDSHHIPNILYCIGSFFGNQSLREFVRASTEFNRAKAREYDRQKLISTTHNRLQQILVHAYETVPFYQSLWKTSGIDIAQITTLNDLSYLPLVSKSDFQTQPVQNLISQKSTKARLLHTSGSTGPPRLALRDISTQIYGNATVRRCFTEHRVLAGSTVLFTYSNARVPIRHRAIANENWTRRIWVSLWDLIESPNLAEQLRPDVVVGSPQQLETLAKLIYSGNRIRPPKVFVSNAERLDIGARHRIENETGSDVVDVYSSSELSTLIAFECRNHSGFHVNSDYVVMEVIDSTGKPVEPGQQGEVVVTDLCNYVSPVIRYRLGDLATTSIKACDCGRALPLLISQIDGRAIDQIRLNGGRILSATSLVDELQTAMDCPLTLIQDTQNAFTLKYYSISTSSQVIAQTNRISQIMRRHLGNSVEIQLCFEELPLALHKSSVKIRSFLSRLPRDEGMVSFPLRKIADFEYGSYGDIKPDHHSTKENNHGH